MTFTYFQFFIYSVKLFTDMKGVDILGNSKSNTKWVKKIIRIKNDYIKVCDYLEFVASKKEIPFREFMTSVFEYSLNYLSINSISFEFSDIKQQRVPKGFSIDSKTAKLFRDCYYYYKSVYSCKYSKKLYLGNFTELLLYIYCMNILSVDDIETIGIKWGINNI